MSSRRTASIPKSPKRAYLINGASACCAASIFSDRRMRNQDRALRARRDPRCDRRLEAALVDLSLLAGVRADGENRRAIYIPKGFALGFQTLTDDAEVTYQISVLYTPQAAGGYRYDDPALPSPGRCRSP
jgi:hypothetical protein